ncbi:MAG: ribonuclease III [Bacteroidota bacterium]
MSKRRHRAKPDTSAASVEELAQAIGFPMDATALLRIALTHKSCANEEDTESNERLEFLGDAVLGLVVGDFLFHEYPGAHEGQLAKLRALVVSAPVLAKQARILELGRFLRLGRGEAFTGGRMRDSNLADVFEAVTGAFFVARGLDAARAFVLAQLGNEIREAASGKGFQDYKTKLQEELQGRGDKPVYLLAREEGPDHGKTFTVEVHANGRLLGQGSGRSKKEAEQLAAQEALEKIKVHPVGVTPG